MNRKTSRHKRQLRQRRKLWTEPGRIVVIDDNHPLRRFGGTQEEIISFPEGTTDDEVRAVRDAHLAKFFGPHIVRPSDEQLVIWEKEHNERKANTGTKDSSQHQAQAPETESKGEGQEGGA